MSNKHLHAKYVIRGTLQYYSGQFITLEYSPGAKIPRICEFSLERVMLMENDEFDAYIAALKKFNEQFWTGSDYIIKDETIRQRYLKREADRAKESPQTLEIKPKL